MHEFVEKYSKLANQSQELAQERRSRAELEAQCEQLRAAHAALEEHNVTLAAALKVMELWFFCFVFG